MFLSEVHQLHHTERGTDPPTGAAPTTNTTRLSLVTHCVGPGPSYTYQSAATGWHQPASEGQLSPSEYDGHHMAAAMRNGILGTEQGRAREGHGDRLHGRVGTGTGTRLCWSYGVREVAILNPVAQPSLSLKIMNLFRILSSWGSSNHRPAAPFLYEVASHVKDCHFGHLSRLICETC